MNMEEFVVRTYGQKQWDEVRAALKIKDVSSFPQKNVGKNANKKYKIIYGIYFVWKILGHEIWNKDIERISLTK